MGASDSQAEEIRNCFGYKIHWTPRHKSPEELHPLIYSYDKLGAEALDAIDEIEPPESKSLEDAKAQYGSELGSKDGTTKKPKRDLYAVLKDNAGNDERLGRLWNQVNTIPEWVDWDSIDRGQKVFYRYGGPSLTALTFLSLLGGMGGGRTVETLARTGGFNVKVVRHRLLETTQHLLQVTQGVDSVKPGGDGFVSSIRVRLLHAHVRRKILQLAEAKPEYYSVKEYGVPVSDLDSIGTINTFSATLIWMGFPRQGIWLTKQEIDDYLLLWRWVAYLLGTPDDWLADPVEAKIMMESIMYSEIKPTQMSGQLANNIITGLANTAPTYASPNFLRAATYWLNGPELSQKLQIDKPPMFYTALIAGQCLFFMAFCYLNRSITSWDESRIKLARKLLFDVVVHNKELGGLGEYTTFEFKHIPNYHKLGTPRGTADNSGLKKAGAERTSLITLVFTGVLAGLVGYGALRGVKGAFTSFRA